MLKAIHKLPQILLAQDYLALRDGFWRQASLSISAIFLMLYFGSLFISPTAKAVCFVVGIASWLVSAHFPKRQLQNPISGILLSLFLWEAVLYVVSPEGRNSFVVFARDCFTNYLPWFWLQSIRPAMNGAVRGYMVEAFVACACLASSVVCLQAGGLFALPQLGPSGFLSQPFTTGGLLLISLFVTLQSLGRLWLSKAKPKTIRRFAPKAYYILPLAFCLQLVALISLSQRAVWLGLGLGLLAWLYLHRRSLSRWLVSGGIAVSCLAGLSFYYLSDKFRHKIHSLFALAEDPSTGCRWNLWRHSVTLIRETPWLGSTQCLAYNCHGDILGHAHNIYLQTLLKTGIPGLGMLLALFFQGIRVAAHNGYYAYVSAFVALLGEGMFEHWIGDSEVYSALLLLLGLSQSPPYPREVSLSPEAR